jgi:hypothetical protein
MDILFMKHAEIYSLLFFQISNDMLKPEINVLSFIYNKADKSDAK